MFDVSNTSTCPPDFKTMAILICNQVTSFEVIRATATPDQLDRVPLTMSVPCSASLCGWAFMFTDLRTKCGMLSSRPMNTAPTTGQVITASRKQFTALTQADNVPREFRIVEQYFATRERWQETCVTRVGERRCIVCILCMMVSDPDERTKIAQVRESLRVLRCVIPPS